MLLSYYINEAMLIIYTRLKFSEHIIRYAYTSDMIQ